MQGISQQQADAYPDTNRGFQIAPTLLRNYMTSDLTKQYMVLLLGAVGFVLLIACANVANVQFARVTGRVGEFAIRSAMGGSRWQIVRQLLVESVLLSLGGAILGLFFAQWSIDMILAHMPADVAKFVAGWKTIRLDTNAFLFAIGISVASGILSGIAPSLISSQTNVAGTLKEGGRGTSIGRGRHRMRAALVIGEVTLALVLARRLGIARAQLPGIAQRQRKLFAFDAADDEHAAAGNAVRNGSTALEFSRAGPRARFRRFPGFRKRRLSRMFPTPMAAISIRRIFRSKDGR